MSKTSKQVVGSLIDWYLLILNQNLASFVSIYYVKAEARMTIELGERRLYTSGF
jgi:hypothetical protein